MAGSSMSRRELIHLGLAGGATALLPTGLLAVAAEQAGDARAETAWGEGWQAEGIANLLMRGPRRLLQSGSNVFPHDPRATAFPSDRRFVNGTVHAHFTATGAGGGVLLRRTGSFTFYAAVYNAIAQTFTLIRKTGRRFGDAGTRIEDTLDTLTDESERVLGIIPALGLGGPVTIRLSADSPDNSRTRLKAVLRTSTGLEFPLVAFDNTPALQAAGDAGVLATAVPGLVGNPGVPALPSLGALFVTDQGAQIEDSPVGDLRSDLVAALSTIEITTFGIRTDEPAGPTAPKIDSATTGRPLDGGARLSVVTDVPAEIAIELARDETFRSPRRIEAGSTNRFNACFVDVEGLPTDTEFFWRARARRLGRESVGPMRRFRTLPDRSQPLSPFTVVVGSCATEFNQPFADIAAEQPDVFVWEGDVDYPDSVGPLAQTVSGFAGIWKDLLWTPQLRPILDRACFAPQRDDHDYGRNDIVADDGLPERGIAPWEHLMNPDIFYSFDAGSAEFWVLDQRRFADSNSAPDNADKTLIGAEQREWLLDSLAASDAPFKIICSPMPFFYSTNNDGGWSRQYTTERDSILEFIRGRVSNQVVAVTGDCHSGAVIERDGILEVRASPLDQPIAGWKAPSEGRGVQYSQQGKFYAVLRTDGEDGRPVLDIQLVRVGLGLGLGLPDEEIRSVAFHRRLRAGEP